MNDKDRKKIHDLKEQVDDARSQLEELHQDMEARVDNIPESFTEAREKAEEENYDLNDAVETMVSAVAALEELIGE